VVKPDTKKCSISKSKLELGSDKSLLPARHYASAVFATATCPDVHLSVCHTPVLCLVERKQDREMYTI